MFKDIEREETHRLSEIADVRKLKEGQCLFFDGEKLDKVYFVLEGKVKLYKSDDNSEKVFISNFARKGDGIFLEKIFGNNDQASFSSEAAEESTILLLDRKKLKKLILKNPIIMANLLSCLSENITELEDSRLDFALTEVAERLLKFLEAESQKHDTCSFELDIPKTDLAQLLGTVPSTLSRALRKLSTEKLIRVSDSEFELL